MYLLQFIAYIYYVTRPVTFIGYCQKAPALLLKQEVVVLSNLMILNFQIGENLYTALQQFLTLFPDLRKAPLTIAGESYAGKHIPSLAVQILWHKSEDEPINLHVSSFYYYFVKNASILHLSNTT